MKSLKDTPPRADAKAVENAEHRAWYPLVLIFAIVAVGIFVGGTLSYRNYERDFRAGIEQELSAIAELKVAQIVQWRRERLVGADYLRQTPYVARRALAVLAHPAVLPTRQNFTASLDSLFACGSYEQALLLDERLNVGLAYPKGASGVLSEAALRAAQQALRSRQVVVADLHRETEAGPVYLSLMVPLVVRRESTGDNVPAAGTGSSPADRSAGLLVLQINAHKELYPMIQFWPTTSWTAETLLVRRDGNDALVLNELRFRTNTALNLRVPLERTDRSSVKAALGQQGIVDARDYRGVPVVAALRAIPNSPWSLVARMDLAEVYAPLRERLWLTVLLMGALLLGAGASVGLVWRQQRVRFYQGRHQAAEALRASLQIIEGILNAMPVRVFWKDKNLIYLGCNAAFARDAGFADPKDIIGKDDSQMGWRDQAELYRGDDRQVIESGRPKLLIEEPLTTPEGHTVTLLTSKIPLRGSNGEISGVLGMYMDITERKQAEVKIQQLSFAVEQSPASIVITDPAGNIEYVNPKFVAVTGYALAEVLGKNPRVLKSGEKGPEAYRELWQTITAGKEWRGEFHNKKKNGELYWESASISPIRDREARITHYVTVKEDITARKQTEAERVRLIQELQAALANVKALSGLLPICAGCKKIRDDKGYWSQVEIYIQHHSEATFTHGLCPDCIKKYYPDLEEPGRPPP